MKTLLSSLTAITLLVASASLTQAAAPSSHDVVVNGKVIGHDPDANVRALIARDAFAAEW